MDLINQTPVPAKVEASEVDGAPFRIGMLSAKATFRFDLDGRVELDTQKPFPLFSDDRITPLGVLPSDAEPRRDAAFEVILLGHAYAPYGRPVEQLGVALTVGAVRRELLISGERYWLSDGRGNALISRPQPFVQMPLTYEHAFGGSQTVQIDDRSFLDVTFPLNPRGRGFDAETLARGVCQMLRAPQGYPQLPNYRRMLPNVESPHARVARWDDTPDPAGWATTPRDMPLNAVLRARAEAQQSNQQFKASVDAPPLSNLAEFDHALLRAHPDWVITLPPTAPTVCLENLVEERPQLWFQVPEVRIVADYRIEGRYGTRPLTPQMLVLLPDERRFYVLYRMPFTFAFKQGDERAFRLRAEVGWLPAHATPYSH